MAFQTTDQFIFNDVPETSGDVVRNAGLRSDGELVQAVQDTADSGTDKRKDMLDWYQDMHGSQSDGDSLSFTDDFF